MIGMFYLYVLFERFKKTYDSYIHMIHKDILKSCNHQGFDAEELYGAYKIFFSTLVSEPRLKIINFLRKGKKNVTEIMDELDMDHTAVSHNLARLRTCGFVHSRVQGKYRYYELEKETIKPLMEIISKHMSKNCIHILRKQREDKNS